MREQIASWLDENASWLMLIPATLSGLALLVLPAGMTAALCVLSWFDPNSTSLILGQELWASIGRTFVYAFSTVLVQLAVGLFAATTVQRIGAKWLAGLVGFLVFLPYTIPCAVTTLIWQLLCRANGFLAQFATLVGLAPNIQWLYSGPGLLLTLVVASIWQFYPFVFVTLLARIRRIDLLLYRTAEIDGATPFRQFIHVTWPALKATIAVVAALRFAFMFTKFDLPWLLGGKSANNVIDTLPVYIWGLVSSSKSVAGYKSGALIASVLAALLLVSFGISYLSTRLIAPVTAFATRHFPRREVRILAPSTPASMGLRITAVLGLFAVIAFAVAPCIVLFVASLLNSRTIGDGLSLDAVRVRSFSADNYRLFLKGRVTDGSDVTAIGKSAASPWRAYARHMVFTILISGATAFVVLFLSIPVGYCMSRFRYRRHRLWEQAPLIGYLFPPIVLLIPYHWLLRVIGCDGTLQGLIAAHVAFCLPFGLWLMIRYFEAVPKQLDKLAAIDGASRIETLARILFQRALPGVVAVATFSFILSWNDVALAGDLVQSSDRWPLVPFIDQEILRNADAVNQYGEFAAASILIAGFAIFALGGLNCWVDRQLSKEITS